MPDPPERGEALCFTAGPQGAAFGAGVIHAWLVSDRPEPRVVAGISTGAVTAAAMQRAMQERGAPDRRTEGTRWEWFQKYLSDMLDRPLDVIWKALPDPVDYFSATTPVHDLSCPESLRHEERAARYHFWIITKLGNWLAGLPVTIGELGTLAVLKVRRDERVPLPVIGSRWITACWRSALFYLQAGAIGAQLLFAVIFRPMFTRTFGRFSADERRSAGEKVSFIPFFRPLFGWKLWLLACLFGILGPLTAVLFALYGLFRRDSFQNKLAAAAELISADGSLSSAKPRFPSSFTSSAMKACCINLNIISNYQLKRRIWNRFATPHDPNPVVRCHERRSGTNLVIVASALQPLKGKNQQCSARSGSSLVEALATACSIHPLFPPTTLRGKEMKRWLRRKDLDEFRKRGNLDNQQLDLMDGAVVRKNPLPALFNWLHENRTVARTLESESQADARIHVIYNVPIEPFDAYQGKPQPDRIDLIEALQVGMLMRTRRDTNVEVEQTNYLSRILAAQAAFGEPCSDLIKVFADELAPAKELKFENPLSPTREEGLTVAAEGCRRTLGRLYAAEIQRAYPDAGSLPCTELLLRVAPARTRQDGSCGLPEVCSHCTGKVAAYLTPPRKPALVKSDFGGVPVKHELQHLCQTQKPRVVFVASGGVFRGAFHIGLLGAMQGLDITPDLVVGASVGTLMGGALAAMRRANGPAKQLEMLAQLTHTFLHVDNTVALTVPVKTAVKQLGLRARKLKLSLARLRAAVRAGTASDVGYASTGVPPIVTDMLSQLFIIPPSETVIAGSDFLAGRFAKAAGHLGSLIRHNTLDSLNVRYAVIGTSLLEGVARRLMGATIDGVDLNKRQPFLRRDGAKSTAIFCTTAFVNQRWPLVLGRDALTTAAPNFRFLYAGLSSSAFPAAFPARQEAEVFPGTGQVTNLFCDGGMFDNLPFVPTIDILSATQRERRAQSGQSAKQFLRDRLNAPDLLICGGFDPLPSEDPSASFASRSAIKLRTAALGAAVKTDSFIFMSRRAAEQLTTLADLAEASNKPCPPDVEEIMTRSVVAGIVNVVPATDLHVNPTFGFSRSLGLHPDRVAASIANGCFQTLRGLAQSTDREVTRSLNHLDIKVNLRHGTPSKGECPYFALRCPFSEAATVDTDRVYQACKTDPVHQKLIGISAPVAEAPARQTSAAAPPRAHHTRQSEPEKPAPKYSGVPPANESELAAKSHRSGLR